MALSDLSPFSGMPEYPDEYLVVEDQLGDTVAQDWLMTYLVKVLDWFYRDDRWMVARNFDFHHPFIKNSKNLIVPDISVFKGIKISARSQRNLQNWNMMRCEKPCPPWVFESSSPLTFENDIDPERKIRLYDLIGAQEYFAYDPNTPRVWPENIPQRLLGWRYDEERKPTKIEPDKQGRLWSEVLESWLLEDGIYLRLYSHDGDLRLTEAEYQRQQTEIIIKQTEEMIAQRKIYEQTAAAKARQKLQYQPDELRRNQQQQ